VKLRGKRGALALRASPAPFIWPNLLLLMRIERFPRGAIPAPNKDFAMKSSARSTWIFTAALFAGLATALAAQAAQCGNGSGGFDAWKEAFAKEARASGHSQQAIDALMDTHYNHPTIGADRGQHSFHLSLDEFLAKRGGPVIPPRDQNFGEVGPLGNPVRLLLPLVDDAQRVVRQVHLALDLAPHDPLHHERVEKLVAELLDRQAGALEELLEVGIGRHLVFLFQLTDPLLDLLVGRQEIEVPPAVLEEGLVSRWREYQVESDSSFEVISG
jgi:hypothetical protein